MEYSKEILGELKKKGIKINDHVVVEKNEQKLTGILMPKSQGSPGSLIIKLENGYNTGIDFGKNTKIKKSREPETKKPKPIKTEKYKPDPSKPTVSILSTGGTIASRIDYNTGGVTGLETAEEIISAIPELQNIANIKIRQVFQMMSEDMEPYH